MKKSNLKNNKFLESQVANESLNSEFASVAPEKIGRIKDLASANLDESYVMKIEGFKQQLFQLKKAVSSLPQALPAVKTNVGVKVKTQLTLPVRIIASPQE